MIQIALVPNNPAVRIARTLATIIAALALFTAGAAAAQDAASGPVTGVKNFGRVTDVYFRGGEVTEEGLRTLHAMGVRTIVNLQDDPDPDEAEICKKLGLEYYAFPLDGSQAPPPDVMDRVLKLVQSATDPIYVHCSGGKHRAGTACALYRMNVQGWTPERAWAEQEAYGFGPPEEHAKLFAWLYADTPVGKRLWANRQTESSAVRVPATAAARTAKRAVATGAIDADARYVRPRDVLSLARSAGATGDLIRLDLEGDDDGAILWKALFSTGKEYRFDALTGEAAGIKMKSADHVAVLVPLNLNSRSVTFQHIVRKVEKATGGRVVELELKHLKGRDLVYYEATLGGGATLYFNARSGKQVVAF